MKTHTCQYPLDLAPGVLDTCDKPAVAETFDLGAMNYLCKLHLEDALEWNDFRFDEVP